MKYDPAKHRRRSIRLKGYDYTRDGWYFITLCVQNRTCLFGEIRNGVMHQNEFGNVVADCWKWLGEQYSYVVLDEWVIMPNHFHGILEITNDTCRNEPGIGSGGSRTATTAEPTTAAIQVKRKPLGRLIGAFKTVSTKQINIIRHTPGAKLWQRNYYEHIIRTNADLERIRNYICQNPKNWQSDSLYIPQNHMRQ
jgi:REP element-mobilizing transposase RayT